MKNIGFSFIAGHVYKPKHKFKINIFNPNDNIGITKIRIDEQDKIIAELEFTPEDKEELMNCLTDVLAILKL